jgi:predicted RNase H-like HicB family nuclease
MNLTFETEQEDDGRWIAEVPELPGVLAYGATQQQAIIKAEALALRVLAERLENAEALPMDVNIVVAAESRLLRHTGQKMKSTVCPTRV